MFPIFLWVEEYKGFKNFQINLDNEYECSLEIGEGIVTLYKSDEQEELDILTLKPVEHYDDLSIIVKEPKIKELSDNKKTIKNFYGEIIEDIKVLVGRNGTGKSSILELLTIEREQAQKLNYILICKHEEIFYLEGNLPTVRPAKALKFLKKFQDNENNGYFMTPHFSFFMNKQYEYLGFPQFNEKHKKITISSIIGRMKYNYSIEENKKNSRKNDDNIYKVRTLSKFSYGYNERQYEYIYIFLKNARNFNEFKNNFKNAKIVLKFNDTKDIYNFNSYKYKISDKVEFNEKKISKEIVKNCDITSHIQNNNKKDRILRAFCNDAYFSILMEQLEKFYKTEDIKNYFKESTEKRNYSQENADIIIEDIKKIHRGNFKYTECLSLEVLLKELLEHFSTYINAKIYYDSFIEINAQIIKIGIFEEANIEKLDFTKSDDNEIITLLKIFDRYKNEVYQNNHEDTNPDIFRFFEMSLSGLSDGEEASLNLFSTINWFIEVDCENRKFITLTLDEPDIFLHPELNRVFFSNLLKLLSQYKDKKFKLIIATHSPYLLSDIHHKDTILLELSEEGNSTIKINNKNTFGANIMDLYKDSFFMESTFGEFAKRKIQGIIEEFNDKENKISEERKCEIWEIIQLIGENLVRKKLENMYYEFFDIKEEKSELEKLIEEKGLSKNDIAKLIEQIKGI